MWSTCQDEAVMLLCFVYHWGFHVISRATQISFHCSGSVQFMITLVVSAVLPFCIVEEVVVGVINFKRDVCLYIVTFTRTSSAKIPVIP